MMGAVGDQVTLRPAGQDDLPIMEKLTWDPAVAGEFAQFGWFDPQLWRRGWDENGLLGAGGGVLMVVRGGERLGFVNWRRKPSTPAAFHWEIGIALLPAARGTGMAPKPTGCSPGTCSRTPPCTASRRPPRWAT